MRVGRDNGAGLNPLCEAFRPCGSGMPGRRRGLRISRRDTFPAAGHWTCICEHDKIGTEGLKTAGQPFERGRTNERTLNSLRKE
jgi:hypothetical protein